MSKVDEIRSDTLRTCTRSCVYIHTFFSETKIVSPRVERVSLYAVRETRGARVHDFDTNIMRQSATYVSNATILLARKTLSLDDKSLSGITRRDLDRANSRIPSRQRASATRFPKDETRDDGEKVRVAAFENPFEKNGRSLGPHA